MRIDLSCPVENRGVTVKTNSSTGEPYALFRLFNLSERVVSGVKFIARAYDSYGKELGSLDVELTELEGQPKSPFAVNKGVSLAELTDAKHVVADITEVTFADGEIYTVREENMTEVNYIQPEYDEVTRIKSAAGSDAACYAQDPGLYWICVCGRPNKEEDSVCIRCGRDKQTSLNKYSSHDKISRAIEEKEQAALAAEQEREAEEARLAELKKKKRLKTLAAALCCVVAIAILTAAGRLIYGAIITKIADGKAEDGNYLEAYEMYRRVGSSHISNVSEQVKGNTFSNMIQNGILTADEKNIYYVDNSLCLMKRDKESGSETQLGEAHGMKLCISGDWLYYTDRDDGSLSRIKTDGSITEAVTDEQMPFYLTIGSDLYYVGIDNDAQQDASQNAEQQQTQQTPIALYRMNLNTKKVKKISSAAFNSLDFYKGKIYYTNAEDNNKLYVMDENGKNARLLIDQPVYAFTVADDIIYYTNGTIDEGATRPHLSLETASLDGTAIETLVSDKKVGNVSSDQGAIYFISYDDSSLYRLDTQTKQAEPVPIESFNIYNISDGYLQYLTASGEMVLAKTDGSVVKDMGALDLYADAAGAADGSETGSGEPAPTSDAPAADESSPAAEEPTPEEGGTDAE